VVAAAGVLVVIALIVAAPLWAPSVMRALPWGSPEKAREPAKPAPQAAAPTPDPAVAMLKAQAGMVGKINVHEVFSGELPFGAGELTDGEK
jgi:hypothetical protein